METVTVKRQTRKIEPDAPVVRNSPPLPEKLARHLVRDVRTLIEQSQKAVAQTTNAALVVLYWQIGQRIRTEILRGRRAEYGEQIVSTLSKQLTSEFGRGFSKPNLSRMVRFAELYPARENVVAVATHLSWSHLVELLPLTDELKREFYSEMCRTERWSVRLLHEKVAGMLYERTALSRKPKQLVRQELSQLRERECISPNLVFRDPYFLDFLGLRDTYSESDLEAAILREMESFILELGAGFAFLARQFRITIDGRDHYLDLLFYHRTLRRLVAIDLKLGEFEASFKGQMELYLRWLERHEQKSGEETPLGLILCAGKSDEQIELLRLDESGIRVATYYTDLPPRDVLRRKLHEAVAYARQRLPVE